MAATDDGRLIASGEDALVAVDLSTGDLLWSREFATAQPAPCPWLAVAQARSTVFCGDLWGGIEESSLDTGLPTGRQLDSQLGAVGPLTVSPDGDELVAIGAGSSAISRWSLDGSGAITQMIARGQVAAAGYDPSGTSIVVAARAPWATNWNDLIEYSVWDPRMDAARLRVPGLAQFVEWAGTDTLLGLFDAIGGYGYLGISTGEHVEGDPLPPNMTGLFRDPGRRTYLTDVTGTITPTDPGTLRRLEPQMRFDGLAVAISASADGATLAVTTKKDGVSTTRLVDAATGATISPDLTGPELTVMAGPGELIAADDDRLLRYSVPELEPIDALPGPQGGLTSLQVSDDRRTLAAGASNDTVTLYDLGAGIRLGDPIPSESPLITPGYLRPDGRELLVNMRDGIAVWNLDPEAQFDAACRLAGRNLTREEWATYFGAIAPYRSTCDFNAD